VVEAICSLIHLKRLHVLVSLQVLLPHVADAFAALHSKGVSKVAMVGHCWGVWVCAHVAADPVLSQTLTCVCGPHPSIGLENVVFKRSVEELAARVTRPFLLMPCQVQRALLPPRVLNLFAGRQ
jgi:hypothetical protein